MELFNYYLASLKSPALLPDRVLSTSVDARERNEKGFLVLQWVGKNMSKIYVHDIECHKVNQKKKLLDQDFTKVPMTSLYQVRSQMKQIWEKFQQIMLPNALLFASLSLISLTNLRLYVKWIDSAVFRFQKVVSKYFWYRWSWQQPEFYKLHYYYYSKLHHYK